MGMIENVKAAAKLAQQIGSIDLYQKILDLQAEALELVEQNATLKAELRELRETIVTDQSLTFEDNFYWRKAPEGPKDGPFCSACWDREKVLVRLQRVSNCYGCPCCGRVLGEGGIMPQPRTIAEYNLHKGSRR